MAPENFKTINNLAFSRQIQKSFRFKCLRIAMQQGHAATRAIYETIQIDVAGATIFVGTRRGAELVPARTALAASAELSNV
jgi:hypothetical protein